VVNDQLFVAMSKDALADSDGPKMMRFMGSILGHQLLILVDSGSSHSFLSSQIANQLLGVQSLSQPIKVQVANGEVLQCISHLLRLSS